MSILRVTDDSDRDELAEALGHCCRTAIRAPHVISQDPLRPSAWDVCHLRLNALLDEWEAAR